MCVTFAFFPPVPGSPGRCAFFGALGDEEFFVIEGWRWRGCWESDSQAFCHVYKLVSVTHCIVLTVVAIHTVECRVRNNHINHINHNHHNHNQPGVLPCFLRVALMEESRQSTAMAVDCEGAARRRRQRRLRQFLCHERLSVAMHLAEAFHHSAGLSKLKVVERRERQEEAGSETYCGPKTRLWDAAGASV